MSFPLVAPSKDPNIKIVIDAAAIFRAYNHGIRQQILTLLKNQAKGMSVTAIYTKLRLEQSVASMHLKTLKDARLVSSERNGKSMMYCYNGPNIQRMQKLAKELIDTLK